MACATPCGRGANHLAATLTAPLLAVPLLAGAPPSVPIGTARRYAGVLLGLSNTAGVLAGVAGSLATGFILQHGSWAQVWHVAIGWYLVGTVIWNTCSTGERIFD
jgi:hypothetical protein